MCPFKSIGTAPSRYMSNNVMIGASNTSAKLDRQFELNSH